MFNPMSISVTTLGLVVMKLQRSNSFIEKRYVIMWSNIMELSYQFEGKLVQLVKTGFNKEV
jgi:hypothetical protein